MLRLALALTRRELLCLWRDRGLRFLLFLGPFLGLFLFASAYSAQVLREIPTAVVDLDHSQSSRELTQKLAQAEYLRLVATPTSYRELRELVRRGEVVVGVVIPEHFARDTTLGRPTRILAIIDASNEIYASNASASLLAVARATAGQYGVKYLVARGMSVEEARDTFISLDVTEEARFNPHLNYAYFLVLALALNLWQQCCTLAATMTVAGEASSPGWVQLRAGGLPLPLLVAFKALVQIPLFTLLAVLLYLLACGPLHLPLRCGLGQLSLLTLAFAVSLQALGTLASTVASNPVDAARFGMLVALPSFILSGYTWPLEAMPPWLARLAWFLPQTWFFQGIDLFALKGAVELLRHYLKNLLLLALLFYGLAGLAGWLRYRKGVGA
ncbi:ABC transporter permease [Desulfothermobacter acidiphilus]|uniref:ABC transporter permease n=1 Tax=Desulfothermobacter acidiphilus TaxID=1938353 RepID=UPI003F8BB60B